MTALILYVMLWVWDNRTFDSITKTNERKVIAERAFKNKQFKKSAILYQQITYGSIFSDPAARLNLAHSYFYNGQLEQALKHYTLLAHAQDRTISSIANNQVGLIQMNKGDSAAALESFKESLRLETGNNVARANYIFLKSHYSGNDEGPVPQSVEKQVKNKVEESAVAEQQNQEIVKDSRKEEFLNSLKTMNMTEDQARAILDAMKTNEAQYIYQLRRRQYAEKQKSSKKIEW
ncbi:hypothetical protein DYBT9275_06116 [Dyadobacter sp. CECT 9275]|uniref:Tetratricopeptide repeat protein n=1 Tax=Dyadobacter helix TaxID=2822344 RepID=A0A916JIA0_9BACT|nr:hypothetical protein [Dyadobacter sp. CECT 9275]CAG5018982.1 hypothetical protein DYBT9275_06116 [Dyadobacter sp. CECT 9275]